MYTAYTMTWIPTTEGYRGYGSVHHIQYTRERLFYIRRHSIRRPEPALLHGLKQLGLLRYRGARAGKFKPRSIQVRMTNHNTGIKVNKRDHCIQRIPALIEINPSRFTFPNIINTNLRGAMINKNDELSTVLKQNDVMIACLTETWLTGEIPSDAINIDGFSCYRKNRSDGRRGGGVAIMVRDCVVSSRLKSIEDDNFEVIWVLTRQPRMPREVSHILIGVIYHPPDNDNWLLAQYLLKSLDHIN